MGDKEMQFATNQVGAVPLSQRTWMDREWLTVPVVAIVAGVLNGELVTAEELARGSGSWNGRPVVLDHPTGADGRYVTANDPARLEAHQVGYLFNVTPNGKLRGEMWLDVERLTGHERGPEVLRALQDGHGVEVSTAYFRTVERKQGQAGDEPYMAIARDLKPDHLAILTDGVGACSWRDGCGAPRINQEGSMKLNIRDTARTPSYDGTETASWADVGKGFVDFRDGYYKHTGADEPDEEVSSVGDAPAAMKTWIAGRTLLGEAGAEAVGDLIFFPVVNPSTDKLNAGALRAVLSGRGSQADIPEGALESARSVASRLLEDEFGDEEEAAQKANVVQRVLGTLRSLVRDLSTLEESFEERAARIREAFYAENQYDAVSGEYFWVRGVFEEYIIVEDSRGLLQYGYSFDEEGDPAFEEPVRVEVEYRPVEDAPQAQAGGQPAPQNTGGENMSELLTAVAERFGIELEENADADALLTALQAWEAPQAEGETPCQEFEALFEYVRDHDGPEAALQSLTALDEATQKQRDELVAALATNERLGFSEDELQAMETALLERLVQLARADYSGVPRQPAVAGDTTYDLPPLGA